MGKPLRG